MTYTLPSLPTDIDVTFPDRSPGDAEHQQHHDTIGGAFADINAAGGLATRDDIVALSEVAPVWGDIAEKPTTFAPVVGTTAGTAAEGNDSRLVNNAKSVQGGAEKVTAFTGTAGSISGDLSAGNTVTLTPTGNVTAMAFINVPASGTSCYITVDITQGSTVRTIAWPTGTTWAIGGAPTQTASKWCLATLYTRDGGGTFKATAVGQS